jgi:hypothetical protein
VINELTCIRTVTTRRLARTTATGRRHIQKGGVIAVSQARRKIARRQQTELEATHAVVAHESKAAERKLAKVANQVEIEVRKQARVLAAAKKKHAQLDKQIA